MATPPVPAAASTVTIVPRIVPGNVSLAQIIIDARSWVRLHWADIILASIVAAVVVATLLAAKWIGHRLRMASTAHGEMPDVLGRALSTIRLWFVAAVALRIVANYAHAPADIAGTVHFVFVIAATLQAAVFAREVILGLVANRAATHEGLGNAYGLIRLLVTVGLFAIAMVLILSNLGVNVTGLIAGLGIGGIAIGLAAQGIFSDLFAALAIIFDRPFVKGDTIRWDTTTGTVEAIGLKTTRVRAQTGEEVIVSNTNLLSKEIHNLARLARRRVIQKLSVRMETPPATCAAIPALVKSIVEGCANTTLLRCGLFDFGASSLDYSLEYDIRSDDYDTVFMTRHDVNVAIVREFARAGIAFAYPAQTTFTAAPDGTLVMPYAAPPLAPDAAANASFDGARPRA
jgi:small-conductance mechanosensitive channel